MSTIKGFRRGWIRLAALLAFAAVFLIPHSGFAAAPATKIVLNARELTEAKDVMTVGNITMVPIRVVSEELWYKVGWNKQRQRITIGEGSDRLVLTLGETSAEAGPVSVSLQQPPFVKSNTTYVPLRFVGTQMGLEVKWDAPNRTVYLTNEEPAEQPVPEEVPGAQPPSASVQQISFADGRLSVLLDGEYSPVSSVLTGPDRIVVDLPDTTLGSGFVQGLPGAGNQGSIETQGQAGITGVRFSLFSRSPSLVRIVIDLERPSDYKIYSQGQVLFVEPAQTGDTPPGKPDSASLVPEVGDAGRRVIVVDAGHGGKQTGAVGVGGVLEKDLNLAMALKVEAQLKRLAGVDIVMTRSDDTTLSLQGRVDIAESVHADAFVSIHGNSMPIGSPPTSGTETLYSRPDSQVFAETMQRHVLEATGLRSRGARTQSLHVTRETTMPAVLVETGFMSPGGDIEQMIDENWQDKVAASIAAGIAEYLGLNVNG
ncbi:N-acetylmuramoyl-L-alanine amidase family protein [Saccharibacillus qingshengii]|uniref:N-acetylmuramoyl-L-alanine amidase family protein n=1 Tax=Saccharibacillus qingshengii TaxID=1763540 RepID=UPI0015562E7A|nr:N-acetylmuramoyl-L-alanine amidase family protein [Saccharibacillus qingshengii]